MHRTFRYTANLPPTFQNYFKRQYLNGFTDETKSQKCQETATDRFEGFWVQDKFKKILTNSSEI